MKILHQFKALADETRLRLLGILAHHELNVGEIVQALNMGQSRISRHLKILMDAGFVVCKRNGLWAFYSTAKDDSSQGLLEAVLTGLTEVPEHKEDLQNAIQVLQDRRQSTISFFDELALDWSKMSQDILGDFNLNALILDHLALCGLTDQHGVVADLGCGPGIMLGLLAQQAQEVIGVDSSARMLEAAAKLLPDQAFVSLRLGDLEHLPLRDDEVDAAIMSLVLHHLPAPRAGVLEMARIVRPGGQGIIADFATHDNESMRSRYGDRWFGFSPADLHAWMQEAGFEHIHIQTFSVNLDLQLLVATAQSSGA